MIWDSRQKRGWNLLKSLNHDRWLSLQRTHKFEYVFRFWWSNQELVTCHMSRVTFQVSGVTCHVWKYIHQYIGSHVTCHMSHVMCQVSHATFDNIYIYMYIGFFVCVLLAFLWHFGGANQWRVHYKRDLPRIFCV